MAVQKDWTKELLDVIYFENQNNLIWKFLYDVFFESFDIFRKNKINTFINFDISEEEYLEIKYSILFWEFSEETKKLYLLTNFYNEKKKLVFLNIYLQTLFENLFSWSNLTKALSILENNYKKILKELTYKKKDITFDALLENNKYVYLSKFKFLYDFNTTKFKNQIVIGARYGVGKTIFSANLIEDIVMNNDNVKVLYFGTAEVDELDFIKRFLVMKSNVNVNYMFKLLDEKERKLEELNSFIEIFNIDKQKFLKEKIISKINEKKINNLKLEYEDINKKITELYQKMQELNNRWINTKAIESELRSLKLKITDLIKIFVNHLISNLEFFEFLYNLFVWANNNLNNEIKEQLEEFKNLIDSAKENWEEISFLEDEFYEKIKLLLKIIWYIKKWELQNFSNESLQHILKQKEYLLEEISKLKTILEEEFNKVRNFIEQNWVQIYNNLNIEFIENKIKETYENLSNWEKIVFIIDYHNAVKFNKEIPEYELSKKVWDLALELSTKYDALAVVMSQLNDVFTKWWVKKDNLSYRPSQAEIRWWEWIAHKVWVVWMIYNRDIANINNLELDKDIDYKFVIYEIYLTKNRYWDDKYKATRRYFILDKKKMRYLPITNESVVKLLDQDKEIIYLDQLRQILIDKYNQLNKDNVDEFIFS